LVEKIRKYGIVIREITAHFTYKESDMRLKKKLLFLAVIALVAIAGTILFFTLREEFALREEALTTAGERMALNTLSVILALMAQSIYRFMEKDIFAGWRVNIARAGKRIETEDEAVEIEDAQMLLEYDWPLWIVLVSWETPALKTGWRVENLLYNYCRSLGTKVVENIDDIMKYTSLDHDRQIVFIDLPEHIFSVA
jgi:hypothetical protein